MEELKELKQLFRKYRKLSWPHEYAEDGVINLEDVQKLVSDLVASNFAPKTEWVSVEERLPEPIQRVLCLTSSGLRGVGYLYKNAFVQDGVGMTFPESGYVVTHWMSLPSWDHRK